MALLLSPLIPPRTSSSLSDVSLASALICSARLGIVITLLLSPLSFGCSGSDGGAGGTDAAGGRVGSGGSGGVAGFGGIGGAGGQPPPPVPVDVVFDSGTETIGSPEFQMDVSVGGPVGKGTARSDGFVLDYYIPTSVER